mgnify:CR=1 FL=1
MVPYVVLVTVHPLLNKVYDVSFDIGLDMTMSLYLFLDMYLHSGEYHVGTVGIDIRNYIFAVLMR